MDFTTLIKSAFTDAVDLFVKYFSKVFVLLFVLAFLTELVEFVFREFSYNPHSSYGNNDKV